MICLLSGCEVSLTEGWAMLERACLAGVLTFLLVWASFHSTARGADMVLLKRSDDGRSITVDAGAVIAVELEERGATGYLWLLDALDRAAFDLLSVESRSLDAPGKQGTSLVKVWRLKARQKGKTVLEFSYCRPWEGKEASLDRFMVEVTIQ
jgi:predicted secreted protein